MLIVSIILLPVIVQTMEGLVMVVGNISRAYLAGGDIEVLDGIFV